MKIDEGRPPTILIVEDVSWIRASMKRSVELQGYRAVEAADDAEAVAVAEREAPELVLTEEEVPTFDALMEHARRHPALRHVPIVIINPDAEADARHSGALILPDYEHLATILVAAKKDKPR